jgi:CRISPR/Cas system CSM-associated protein Csm3 (group 7 of RAMP superfamily)
MMHLHPNPLMNKIIGELTFTLKSPLNVGSGDGERIRDFLRLPDGRLIIPSTTWKGAFRNLSELIARNTAFSGLPGLAVRLYAEKKAGITYRGDGEQFSKYVESFKEEFSKKGKEFEILLRELGYDGREIERALEDRVILEKMAEDYLAIHCPIGKLYGNRVLAGKIRFLDTLLRSGMIYKPGVGIDRASGKAKEGALYGVNVIPPGPQIKLKMIIDNLLPGEDDARLFGATLKTIKAMDLSIGSRKSVGLGHLGLQDGVFYMVDLRNDKNFAIGNPFKKGRKMTLEELIQWLQG